MFILYAIYYFAWISLGCIRIFLDHNQNLFSMLCVCAVIELGCNLKWCNTIMAEAALGEKRAKRIRLISSCSARIECVLLNTTAGSIIIKLGTMFV